MYTSYLPPELPPESKDKQMAPITKDANLTFGNVIANIVIGDKTADTLCDELTEQYDALSQKAVGGKKSLSQSGYTPLIEAIRKQNTRLLSALQNFLATKNLTSELDINFQDANGKTALMHAVSLNPVDLIAIGFLLSMGASLDKTDKSGKTALQHAIAQGKASLFDTLYSKKFLSEKWNHDEKDWMTLLECEDINLAAAMFVKMHAKIEVDIPERGDKNKRFSVVKSVLFDAIKRKPELAIKLWECLELEYYGFSKDILSYTLSCDSPEYSVVAHIINRVPALVKQVKWDDGKFKKLVQEAFLASNTQMLAQCLTIKANALDWVRELVRGDLNYLREFLKTTSEHQVNSNDTVWRHIPILDILRDAVTREPPDVKNIAEFVEAIRKTQKDLGQNFYPHEVDRLRYYFLFAIDTLEIHPSLPKESNEWRKLLAHREEILKELKKPLEEEKVEAKSSQDWPEVFRTTVRSSPQVIKEKLSGEIAPNAEFGSPLLHAARVGHVRMLEYLLNQTQEKSWLNSSKEINKVFTPTGTGEKHSPLLTAVKSNSRYVLIVVELLLRQEDLILDLEDENEKTALVHAADLGLVSVFLTLLSAKQAKGKVSDSELSKTLTAAVECGNLTIISKILEYHKPTVIFVLDLLETPAVEKGKKGARSVDHAINIAEKLLDACYSEFYKNPNDHVKQMRDLVIASCMRSVAPALIQFYIIKALTTIGFGGFAEREKSEARRKDFIQSLLAVLLKSPPDQSYETVKFLFPKDFALRFEKTELSHFVSEAENKKDGTMLFLLSIMKNDLLILGAVTAHPEIALDLFRDLTLRMQQFSKFPFIEVIRTAAKAKQSQMLLDLVTCILSLHGRGLSLYPPQGLAEDVWNQIKSVLVSYVSGHPECDPKLKEYSTQTLSDAYVLSTSKRAASADIAVPSEAQRVLTEMQSISTNQKYYQNYYLAGLQKASEKSNQILQNVAQNPTASENKDVLAMLSKELKTLCRTHPKEFSDKLTLKVQSIQLKQEQIQRKLTSLEEKEVEAASIEETKREPATGNPNPISDEYYESLFKDDSDAAPTPEDLKEEKPGPALPIPKEHTNVTNPTFGTVIANMVVGDKTAEALCKELADQYDALNQKAVSGKKSLSQSGYTPLIEVIRKKDIKLLSVLQRFLTNKKLRASDLDINFKDQEGKTALIHAVTLDFVDSITIDFLLKNGASLAVKDKSGKTALQHAIGHGKASLFDRLCPKKGEKWNYSKEDWMALEECKDINLAAAVLEKMYARIKKDFVDIESNVYRYNIIKPPLLHAIKHRPELAIKYMECISRDNLRTFYIDEILEAALSSQAPDSAVISYIFTKITPWGLNKIKWDQSKLKRLAQQAIFETNIKMLVQLLGIKTNILNEMFVDADLSLLTDFIKKAFEHPENYYNAVKVLENIPIAAVLRNAVERPDPDLQAIWNFVEIIKAVQVTAKEHFNPSLVDRLKYHLLFIIDTLEAHSSVKKDGDIWLKLDAYRQEILNEQKPTEEKVESRSDAPEWVKVIDATVRGVSRKEVKKRLSALGELKANDVYGNPLLYAVRVGNIRALEFFLEKEKWTLFDSRKAINSEWIDPRTKEKHAPLLTAVKSNTRYSFLIIELLLQQEGLILDLKDEKGKTALVHAADLGSLSLFLTIFAKASKRVSDAEFSAALSAAVGHGDLTLISKILEYYAPTVDSVLALLKTAVFRNGKDGSRLAREAITIAEKLLDVCGYHFDDHPNDHVKQMRDLVVASCRDGADPALIECYIDRALRKIYGTGSYDTRPLCAERRKHFIHSSLAELLKLPVNQSYEVIRILFPNDLTLRFEKEGLKPFIEAAEHKKDGAMLFMLSIMTKDSLILGSLIAHPETAIDVLCERRLPVDAFSKFPFVDVIKKAAEAGAAQTLLDLVSSTLSVHGRGLYHNPQKGLTDDVWGEIKAVLSLYVGRCPDSDPLKSILTEYSTKTLSDAYACFTSHTWFRGAGVVGQSERLLDDMQQIGSNQVYYQGVYIENLDRVLRHADAILAWIDQNPTAPENESVLGGLYKELETLGETLPGGFWDELKLKLTELQTQQAEIGATVLLARLTHLQEKKDEEVVAPPKNRNSIFDVDNEPLLFLGGSTSVISDLMGFAPEPTSTSSSLSSSVSAASQSAVPMSITRSQGPPRPDEPDDNDYGYSIL